VPLPHVTIIGAGAIGGAIGAHLVRAGHSVLFVDGNTDHVAAINRDGLTIEGVENFHVRAHAVTPHDLPAARGGRPLDIVLLAVKGHDTESALEPLGPLLDDRSYLVSLQNGLNERPLTRRLGSGRSLGAFMMWGGNYLSPGHILFSAKKEFTLGEWDGTMTDRLELLVTTLRAAFLPHTDATSNIRGFLWGKLGYEAILFATATLDETVADVLATPRYRPMLANLAAEIIRVADAEGVRSEGFSGYDPNALRFANVRDWTGIHRAFDARVDVQRQTVKQFSGMWRDLAVRRRRTEVDHHLGEVVAIAGEHAIPMPLNARLIQIIHGLEAGTRERSPANLDELIALNDETYR